ncbi:MAG: ATP synthase F1 subunit epsilon [Cyanobacteria bacterium P01_C01_bin.89]
MSLTVKVIAPDSTVWDAPADEVVLPSTTGQVGILPAHAPLLTALDTGVMRVRDAQSQWTAIALMGGFAEVENDEVVVLVNGAERGSDIDQKEAEAALADAQKALDAVPSGISQERIKADQALKRARARAQAAGGAE